MSFSTTLKLVNTIPGQTVATCVLSDTAGNGDAIDFGACDNITLQIVAAGTAATVTVQCSNDGSNFVALPTAVSAASGAKSIPFDGLGFRKYRLVLSGGAADTVCTCTFVGSNTKHARPA